MNTALTIAGSDPSGGAGIQADIKTMTVHGVYAMSVITALTAQNTTGVTGIMEVTPDFMVKQLDSVLSDIRPDAVKTGMLMSGGLIEIIADKLSSYNINNIVVDPVMISTSGSRLISEDAIEMLKSRLLPMATLVTPNIPEAEVLAAMSISDKKDMEKAALAMCEEFGCNVLLKGGHSVLDTDDLLVYRDASGCNSIFYPGRRIDNPNTHGTGCTLSSAIAANLAKGISLQQSIRQAKEYINGALEAGLDLGKGSGPMNHAFML